MSLLPSVINTDYPNLEIVVADNCSTDNSVEFCRTTYPNIKLIVLEENYGYAGGYNHALQQVDADYYVLLNSDVEVPSDWIKPLVDFAEKEPTLAAAQPYIMDFKHRQRFEYAGAAGGWIDAYGYPFCRGRVFDTLEDDNGQFNGPEKIFWASGAALFVRAADFHACGGFDQHFFAHMEEIDLCWRLQRSGKTIWAINDSKVFHIGGGTLNQQSHRKTYLNFRNGLLLLEKNLPAHSRSKTILKRMVLDGIAALRFLATGGFKHFMAIVNAHIYFHRNRAKFRPQIPVVPTDLSGFYAGSIVWQFFAKKRKTFKEIINA